MVQPQIGIRRVVNSDSLGENLHPVSREIYQYGQQSSKMKRDIERQSLIFPTKQPGRESEMGRTADGQELSDCLHEGKHNRLMYRHESSGYNPATNRLQ